MTAMRSVLAALAVVISLGGSALGELLVNGLFLDGLTGWTQWTQRNDGGNFTVAVNNGVLEQRGDSYNGGIYQVVAVPANVPLTIDGAWQSNPTVASEQWAEVIVVEGNNPPVDGQDVTGPLIFKNDTFGGDVGGWFGAFAGSSPVANDPFGGPLGAGSPSGFVTVILKSGSINPGTLNGVDFFGVALNAVVPEPSSVALLAAAGAAFAPIVLRRRLRSIA
ncbi:MAG: PEP-CTERM sorting domain-containing protein [Pirellulales bacterium]